MPKATTARAGKHIFEIEKALEMRAEGMKPDFRCLEWGEPVRAHKKGTTDQAAHFEHLNRNLDCPLSD
jgi:hypothetical protein